MIQIDKMPGTENERGLIMALTSKHSLYLVAFTYFCPWLSWCGLHLSKCTLHMDIYLIYIIHPPEKKSAFHKCDFQECFSVVSHFYSATHLYP